MANSIEDLFRAVNIDMQPGHTSGRKYYKCPSCSPDRKGMNRNSRCLAVNVDDKGIQLYCNHCDNPEVHRGYVLDSAKQQAPRQQGGQVSAGQGRSISDRAMPKRNGYEALHKAGRAQWARR